MQEFLNEFMIEWKGKSDMKKCKLLLFDLTELYYRVTKQEYYQL